MVQKLKALVEIIKPERTAVNVMTAAAGYFVALGANPVQWLLLFKILIGSGAIIASACVFNNLLDRRIDRAMRRTQKRALVVKSIGVKAASGWLILLGLIGFAILAQINLLTFWIGWLAYVSYVFIYGYAKRNTSWSTLIGTLPGGLSIVAGYTAISGRLDHLAIALFGLLLTWQMAHFYAIAVYRQADYAQANLPVWSVKYGINSTKKQIYLFELLYLVTVTITGILIASPLVIVLGLIVSANWLRQSRGGQSNWAHRSFSASLSALTWVCLGLVIASIWSI